MPRPRQVCGELATSGRPQPVAVKTLPELTHAEQRAQLERELAPHLRAMQAADGVCRVLGTCEKDGRPRGLRWPRRGRGCTGVHLSPLARTQSLRT